MPEITVRLRSDDATQSWSMELDGKLIKDVDLASIMQIVRRAMAELKTEAMPEIQ